MTALTPERDAAFAMLIDLMRAWACGLRRTLPQSMPGSLKSAPNAARPVTLSIPSGRMVRFPIHLLLESWSFIWVSFMCFHVLREAREASNDWVGADPCRAYVRVRYILSNISLVCAGAYSARG